MFVVSDEFPLIDLRYETLEENYKGRMNERVPFHIVVNVSRGDTSFEKFRRTKNKKEKIKLKKL